MKFNLHLLEYTAIYAIHKSRSSTDSSSILIRLFYFILYLFYIVTFLIF